MEAVEFLIYMRGFAAFFINCAINQNKIQATAPITVAFITERNHLFVTLMLRGS